MKKLTGMLVVAVLLATLAMPLSGSVAADQQTGVLPIVRFEGIIQSRPEEQKEGIWSISGQEVEVVAETRILEQRGDATVGAHVVVNARHSGEGLVAMQIRVVEPAQATVRIQGVISELFEDNGSGYVVVNGLKVDYDGDTTIIGDLAVGARVKIEALMAPEGYTATKIEVLGFPWIRRIVEFEGTIESIVDSTWVVDGHEFTLSELTVIIGVPEQDKYAEVRALQQPDDSLVALWIRIREEPEIESWEGPIERLPRLRWGFWIVDGKAVLVTPLTEMTGDEPALGNCAYVEAERHGLLLLQATKIEVADSPCTETVVPEVEVK
jgi:hypothetical protein